MEARHAAEREALAKARGLAVEKFEARVPKDQARLAAVVTREERLLEEANTEAEWETVSRIRSVISGLFPPNSLLKNKYQIGARISQFR